MMKFNIIKLELLSNSKISYESKYSGINELSGFCIYKDTSNPDNIQTYIYAVSDDGIGYRANILDFIFNEIFNFVLIEDDGTKKKPIDCEGITIDNDGNLYIVSERDKTLNTYENKLPTGNIIHTPTKLIKLKQVADKYEIDKEFEFDLKDKNNPMSELDGFEGVAYIQGSSFYLGFQKGYQNYNNGCPLILKFSTLSLTITSKIELRFTSEIADIEYIPKTRSVWILDSETGKIHICNETFECIQTLDLGNITYDSNIHFRDLNPESFCVDWDNKIIYVGTEQNVGDKNIFIIHFDVEKKLVSSVYFYKQVINKIIQNSKILWSKITSCFGSGIWHEVNQWSETENWKE